MTRSGVLFALIIFITSIPSSIQWVIPIHHSCIGGQYNSKEQPNFHGEGYGIDGRQYRRTIGSSMYYDLNPKIWFNFSVWDKFSFIGKGQLDPVQVRLHRIEVDDRPLNGWIHVVITIDKESPFHKDGFGILLMNGRISLGDDSSVQYHRGGGEFVHGFPKCDGDDHEIDKVTVKHQFAPCGGICQAEQVMTYGFQYVQPETDPPKYPELVPTGPGPHNEFHLNFRFSSQACNHPDWLTIASFVHFTQYHDGYRDPFAKTFKNRFGAAQELYMNQEYVVGAADPIPRPGTYKTINCDKEYTVKYKDLKFIKKAPKDLDRDVYFRTAKAACGVNPSRNWFQKYETTLFWGRCNPNDIHQGHPRRYYVNKCKREADQRGLIDPSTGNKAMEYEDHIKELHFPHQQHCLPCPTVPPRPNSVKPTVLTTTSTTKPGANNKKKKIQNVIEDDEEVVLKQRKKGIVFAGNEPALRIWDARIIHGIMMTVLTFFVSPVNIFMTRFFKETFLDTRIMFLQIWYFVHHISILASLFLYSTGLFRLVTQDAVAGNSVTYSAEVHRALGWTTIAVYILMVLLGGFRAVKRDIRTIIIGAHWTIGMFLHFSNYACCILSLWIPGSPAATVDVSELKEIEDDVEIQLVLVVASCWIVFDVIMNIVMTCMIIETDKRLGLTRDRYWLPSPMPVIPEHETRDIKGSKTRKMMLAGYCVTASLTTFVICFLIRDNPVGNRGMGEMSCTHSVAGGHWTVGKCNF